MFDLSKDKIFLNIALSLLLGIFSIFILSSFGFIIGLSININYILSAVIAAVIIPLWYFKFDLKECLFSLLCIIVLVVFSYLISVFIMDFSNDGPWYHQTGIIFLKKGWNPIYTPAEDFFHNYWNAHITGLLWVDNYPKFYEIFAANIFYLTNNIEAGKMLNFLSLGVLFFYALYILRQGLLKKHPFASVVFSFLIIFNPIVCAQIYTYYVDALVYVYFMLMIFALIDIEQTKDNRGYIVFAISAVLLSNLKLVGILYTLLIIILYTCYRIFYKSKLKTWGKVSAVVLVLILLTGINPYFTNLMRGKHILYPVAGAEKIDIMTHNMPPQFLDKSMPYKLFMSTFSKVDNIPAQNDGSIQLKIPFTIYPSEIKNLHLFDIRQSGFGIFWSGILLISLILAFFIKIKDKKTKQQYCLIMGILLSSVLLNTENWWARYVPQFYAVPIFILLFYYISNLAKQRILVTTLLSVLIFFNSAVALWRVQKIALSFTETKSMQLNNMENSRRTPNVIKNLEQDNIRADFTAPVLLFLDKYSRKSPQ